VEAMAFSRISPGLNPVLGMSQDTRILGENKE
jgi:hypothetical protein